MTVPLTAGQKSELLLALGDRIDHIRERINRNVALTVNPHRTDGGAKAADRALQWARQQRDAEHAYYRNSGGHIDEYLPAVYRDPRAARRPDLGPMRTPERRPGTAGEGTAPASRPSPANLSDRTPEPRTPTSPHEGPARATSVGRNNLSEPEALREAATPDGARDRKTGVASEERLFACCQGFGEHFGHCPLVAKVTDRGGPRYISRLGDRRQHPVRCSLCRQPTAALDGLCDPCAVRAAVRAVTHLDDHAKEVLLCPEPR